MRVGIYGGSFNPVHFGHLMVADAVCYSIKLDCLFWVPAACSPFKEAVGMAPGDFRLNWLKLALQGRENYFVDDQELMRGGYSYTIDTVRSYVQCFPGAELFYLIGMDNLASLPKWRSSSELAELVKFVAVSRPGQSCELPPAPFRVVTLNSVHTNISSSRIRQSIKEGRPIRNCVPKAVLESIINSGFYR